MQRVHGRAGPARARFSLAKWGGKVCACGLLGWEAAVAVERLLRYGTLSYVMREHRAPTVPHHASSGCPTLPQHVHGHVSLCRMACPS